MVHCKRTTSYPNFKQNLDKTKMSIHPVKRVTFYRIISIYFSMFGVNGVSFRLSEVERRTESVHFKTLENNKFCLK